MREATAVVEELNRIASQLDAMGHHAEADKIDALSLRIAADRRKKRQRTVLTPFGKAVTYGVPALLAGGLLTQHGPFDGQPNGPSLQDSDMARNVLNVDVKPVDRNKVSPEFDFPDMAPGWSNMDSQRSSVQSKPVSPKKTTVPVSKPNKPNRGNFDKFKQFTLPEEGGFVHRKKSADPGGATNMGVTQRTYNAWRDSMNKPRQSVRKMTAEEAHEIMYQMYWKSIRAHELPERTAVALADMGYHDGPGDAIRLLQQILGVPQTGVVGPMTMQKAWEYANTPEKDQALAVRITDLREKSLRTRPHAKANPGWFNRTERMRDFVKDPEVFPGRDQTSKNPDAPDKIQGE